MCLPVPQLRVLLMHIACCRSNATTWCFQTRMQLACWRALNPDLYPSLIRRYVLMLFRQQGTYSAPMTPDDGRFNFDVNAFAARYNLGLPVAVNWFTTQPDAGP